MKRRNFLELVAFLPVFKKLSEVSTVEDILKFDMSEIASTTKLFTTADKTIAALFKKNLLYTVKYVLNKSKDLTDVTALKNLAIEADKKFYSDNSLKAESFTIQPLTMTALKNFSTKASVDVTYYNEMIKTMTTTLEALKDEKLGIMEKIIAETTKAASTATSSADQAEKAKAAQACQKTVTMVTAVIVSVILAVVAIIVAIFSFGVTATVQASNSIIDAALLSTSFTVQTSSVVAGSKNISLSEMKIDLSKYDIENLVRCSISSGAVCCAMASYGKSPYPVTPFVGSLAVSIIATVRKIPGIENIC